MKVLDKRYKRLQQKLLRLGLVIPGTIRTVYLKCGKEGCCCMTGTDADKHGPYLFWSLLFRRSQALVSATYMPIFYVKFSCKSRYGYGFSAKLTPSFFT